MPRIYNHDNADRTRADILQAMGEREYSTVELAERAGYSRSVINRHIAVLKKQCRVYVAEWRNRLTPVYAVGALPNAPRPAKMTSTERSAKYYAKMKGQRDAMDGHRNQTGRSSLGIFAGLLQKRVRVPCERPALSETSAV